MYVTLATELLQGWDYSGFRPC